MRSRTGRFATSVVLLALGLACLTLLPSAPTPTPARAAAPVCTISVKLVNSCRPWIGAESGGYGGLGSTAFRARMLEHEARIGRPLDIVHAYTGVGAVLSSDIRTLAQRPDTIALVNWRVSFNWAAGDGRSATVNTQIDAMANSIKSLGTTKIMLTVYHEPESSISPGGSPSCPAQNLNGTSGSTSDYVNMWHNVRQRFDALGVSNVVWVMNYIGYVTGHCSTKDLWPGNDYVDWVMWDPYPKNASWTATVDSFYNYLTSNSDAEHDFLSKPWGLAEYGYVGSSQTAGYAMYDEARRNLQNGVHPRLKAFVVWDNYTSSSHDDRVGYAETHVADPVEQEHYNAFVNDPLLLGTAVPEPTDLSAPTAALSSPLDGATVADRVVRDRDRFRRHRGGGHRPAGRRRHAGLGRAGRRRGCDPRVEQRHRAQRGPHAEASRTGRCRQPRSLRRGHGHGGRTWTRRSRRLPRVWSGSGAARARSR